MTYIKGLACHVLISPNGGKRHAGLRVSGGIMDDSALRRQQLLKDTRRMYDSGIPAIHPRYRPYLELSISRQPLSYPIFHCFFNS